MLYIPTPQKIVMLTMGGVTRRLFDDFVQTDFKAHIRTRLI